jgi:hypothetical protein
MRRIVSVVAIVIGFSALATSNAGAAICADGHWRAGCVGRHGGFAVGPRGYAYDYRGHYGYHSWGHPSFGRRLRRR